MSFFQKQTDPRVLMHMIISLARATDISPEKLAELYTQIDVANDFADRFFDAIAADQPPEEGKQ